jgi:hypothetical protein
VKGLERRVASPGLAWSRPQIERGRFPSIVAFAILFLCATLIGSRAAGQPAPNETSDSVRGTVVNSATHQPVPRALVFSPDSRFATMTDNEGHFEFTFPRVSAIGDNAPDDKANRPAALIARKPGFLRDSDAATQDLASNVPNKELTISLVPEAVIVGTVTLPTSEAPDSIFLQVYRRQVRDGAAHWVPAGGAQSRSDGGFRFADLPAGIYKVLTRESLDRDPLAFDSRGQLYGYPPAYSQNARDFSSAGTIQISAGMTGTANLSLTRQPYYRIHIPVTNAAADAGVGVNVSVAGRAGPGFSLGYNNQERAIEGMLPNGVYQIEASSFGRNSAAGFLTITVRGAAVRGPAMTLAPITPIRVDVKEEFTSADKGGTISFSVNGRPVTLRGPRRYLNVILESADDSDRGGVASLRSPTGPGDEALVIENARPGRYWIRVISSRGYVASLRSGNIDLRYEPLVVAAGGSTSPIEITMRDDTAEIDGTVEGITSPALSSLNASPANSGVASFSGPRSMTAAPAHIYFIPLADGGGQYSEAWVSADGTFNSPPLAPGVYRVLAFERPQYEIEYRNPEAVQAYETKGPAVRIAAGQKEHVRLQLLSSND